ncbi:MAG: hypothetical protein A2V69_00780 [Candidatus Portnoybacteria bacterium RBG_13_40_8]|uniref:Uncharacterized protein n=1 Tax=Candidatus Portnoybacteria bacterium RBG_13_40_8 TaxID=1801990 RepID=A0A1G2F461_9BACT|nr:MAG: hypothetical protein A2V69_00780 [Candidatus Portnoybacteria bacterium RBG_13_40_8]OGZ34519.1 MAG: hypothetical protein A2V60_03050 [Candidatus Portnoybacteria bacterium RIFCSPHIGHO2_01_FULL_39_19]
MWYIIGGIVIVVVILVFWLGKRKPKASETEIREGKEEQPPAETVSGPTTEETTEEPIETPSEETPSNEEDLTSTDENQPLQ